MDGGCPDSPRFLTFEVTIVTRPLYNPDCKACGTGADTINVLCATPLPIRALLDVRPRPLAEFLMRN